MFEVGQPFPTGFILWTSGDAPSGQVAILLADVGSIVGTLTTGTPDDGQFNPASNNLSFPPDIPAGDTYRIQVVDSADEAVFGFSEPFTIQNV